MYYHPLINWVVTRPIVTVGVNHLWIKVKRLTVFRYCLDGESTPPIMCELQSVLRCENWHYSSLIVMITKNVSLCWGVKTDITQVCFGVTTDYNEFQSRLRYENWHYSSLCWNHHWLQWFLVGAEVWKLTLFYSVCVLESSPITMNFTLGWGVKTDINQVLCWNHHWL